MNEFFEKLLGVGPRPVERAAATEPGAGRVHPFLDGIAEAIRGPRVGPMIDEADVAEYLVRTRGASR